MRSRWILAGLMMVALLGACGSAAPATQTAAAGSVPPATAATGATAAPPTAVPSSAAVASPAGAGSTGDPELAAKFPTQVAGKPVADVTTAKLADFFRAMSVDPAKIATEKTALAALGVDLEAMTFGDATATVGGNNVSFQAYRAPGMDATRVAQGYLTFADARPGDVLKPETLSGKSILVVRSADGNGSTWLYPSGDTLWSVGVSTPTTNEDGPTAIFAALQ